MHRQTCAESDSPSNVIARPLGRSDPGSPRDVAGLQGRASDNDGGVWFNHHAEAVFRLCRRAICCGPALILGVAYFTVIPDASPTAVSLEHLTAALRRAGVLPNGRVSSFVIEGSRNTILSRITRLRLVYEGSSDAPRTVILKTAHPDRKGGTGNAGRHEVEFYTQVAATMAGGVVPRCFEAKWEPRTNAWHILLEDLNESHCIAPPWPMPPTMQQCASIVRARARFQAAWWDDPRLGISVGTWPDADNKVQNLAADIDIFIDRMGDSLPRHRLKLYQRLLEAAPRLLARTSTRRNLTINQGDAHVWNCFLPRNSSSEDVRIFDWDSWCIDTGTRDLAYMMAIHWYPDLRREREQPLLDHYHAALVAHGVAGYDRSALEADYRLSVLWQITTPVWQAVHDIPPVIWWNNLGRVLLAVDDLGCGDLLA